MQTPNHTKQLIYIADPMCSWCYGFAPTIGAIEDALGPRLPITLLMGGLRAGNRKPTTTPEADAIRAHWRRVQQATGQPFDFEFFENRNFVYDTEPACRAVVTMRLLNPKLALPYLHRIQRAFYAELQDTTKTEVLANLAADMGVDRQAFLTEIRSAEARDATLQDFVTAQRTGIKGFPTLLVGPTESGFLIVTEGFRPPEGLIPSLESWLEGAEPQQ